MVPTQDTYSVFTVCNLAYLPRAMVLAESFLFYNHKKITIYICDRQIDLQGVEEIANINWIEDQGISNLSHLAFKYDVTEFTTAIKPLIALKLLNKFKKVIFLDPDICLFSPIDPILAELEQHPILVTPHYISPEPDSYPFSDIGMMRFGSVNLGFFGVRQSEDAASFLKWLDNRCQRFCFFETQFGLSTDQKWVSIAPCLFQTLHISTNPGYNVAFWNIRERRLSRSKSGGYIVNEAYPLIFFHFSSFDEEMPERLTKRPLHEDIDRRQDIKELCLKYSNSLKNFQKVIPFVRYHFDFMSNGNYISPALRRAYACIYEEMPEGHDPFDFDGPIGRFAKRNYLIQKKDSVYISAGYGDIESNKGKLYVVNLIMRMLLKMMGPNQFSNLSRLLVYLSSYRQNRALWRL